MKAVEISKEFSRIIYDDGHEAASNQYHPCHHFVNWQIENGYTGFQLPEPFSGRCAELGIVFLSLNPSISDAEIFPRYEDNVSFENYDEFFRSRFDDEKRNNSGRLKVFLKNDEFTYSVLWNNIEKFGSGYLSSLTDGPFKLGKHAILVHTVCYKSTKGWLGNKGKSYEKQACLKHQYGIMKKLFNEIGYFILVPMGNEALKAVKSMFKFSMDVPNKIGEAMGNVYYARIEGSSEDFEIPVIPIMHLSYAKHIGKAATCQVPNLIIKAFKGD